MIVKAGGVGGSIASGIRSVLGYRDIVDEAKNEYNSLKSLGITTNLPKGAASDKDIELVSKGFPSADAPTQTLVGFLRGMEKLNRYQAQLNEATAEWVTENKFKGALKKDSNIMDIDVPKGTTLLEFSRKHGDELYEKSKAARPTELETTAQPQVQQGTTSQRKAHAMKKPSYFSKY